MRRKKEFLNRLFELLKCKMALLEFLKEEKLITESAIMHMMHEHKSSHIDDIFNILNTLAGEDKLQLVDYEWTILPVERLKLTLVSSNHKKEFEYSP